MNIECPLLAMEFDGYFTFSSLQVPNRSVAQTKTSMADVYGNFPVLISFICRLYVDASHPSL